MTDEAPPTAPKKTYRKISEYVWDAVRRDFVSGAFTLPKACERHNAPYKAAAARAKRYGWRNERVASVHGDRGAARAAQLAERFQATPPPWPVGSVAPAASSAPSQAPADAARDAFARSAQAMAEGRPHEAQAWARLTAQMAALKLGDPDDDDTAADPRAAARPPDPGLPVTPDLSGPPPPRDDYFDETVHVWQGGHYKYGGNAPRDPNHIDDGLDLFRYYTPGKPNTWDKLTALCEKRLDMLLRDWWTGGHWDPKLGKPRYVMDRDGRIRRSGDVEDSWFEPAKDERDERAWYDLPLPTVRDLPAPPLDWIMEVWLPDWNARHPDAPCHVAQAWTIHQLFTRDPRLEAELISEQLLMAREKWQEHQRARGLPPDPDPKADWTDADAARAAEREAAWSAIMARRAEAEAAEAAAGKAPTVMQMGPWRVRRF